MLKITLHDSSRELRFKLEGKLSGPWVGELQQCWRTAASATSGRSTVVDLGEVDFVDCDGQSLLAGNAQRGSSSVGADSVDSVASRGGLWHAVLWYG